MSGGVKKLAQVVVGAVIGFVQGGPVGAVIGAGLAFYAAEQQEKLNTKSPLRDNEPSAQTVRSSKAPVRYILGRVSTGGVLVWAQEERGAQTTGEWLHLVYVLCEGAIDELEYIYLGEELIGSYGADASYELVVNPTQVNTFLKENCPDWKDTQIGRGLSYVRISLRYSAEKFPSGIPDARFVVRGRNDIYDPRTGRSGWTDNTALHLLWFLRTRCGVPDDEIVFETFASGANVCNESVQNPDGSSSPRYRSGCVIGADEQRTNVLQKLEAACAGKLIRVGGRWMFQAGAYYGPYDFEITEDMVIGTITGNTEATNDAAINTIRGTFIDPQQSWTETDYPEVAVAQWVEEDGGEAAETLSFSYVSDPYQAQRLANIELRRRRSGGALNIPLNLAGYNCRPGRAVRVNLPSLNILGEFMVTNWSMGTSEGCTASVQAYEAAIFDDAVGKPYNPIGFIKLPAGGLGSPTNLRWEVEDAAEISQGVLGWDRPAGIVSGFAVTVRQAGTAVQALQVPETTTRMPISGLTSGSYTMGVAALGPLARSGEATITVDVNGPPMPETCAVQATIDTITLIPGNTLHGLNGGTYEYFWSPDPAATQGEFLGRGLSITHTGLSFAKSYAYFVRSKNAYGVSAFLKVVAATSMDVGAILEGIKGKITESELGKELTSKIEKIALIDSNGPGSVNERIGTAKTELAKQISDVNNALGTVKGNLEQQITAVSADVSAAKTELQQQIANVSALAGSLPYRKDKAYSVGQSALGSDGKLYQALKAVPLNTPPPNATYWTDVGQAVVTANGMAARVSKVETDVSTLDGKVTAQASQISGLQSSLTTTNGNVSAAQQAAQDAATLAGGKGKVIVQSAAPAVADRLAQNLWIDTTSNANTPKRWSGSAWVAVTDKVATDAAAAAAGALALAQTKADASVVSSLTTRVSDAEGKLTSQATKLEGMQTSIDGKASSQALQQVTSRVTATEDKDKAQDQLINSQSQALTSLTDSVSKKADASTVQALGNMVTQQGQELTAQGQSLTKIDAALGQVGGENLVYNPSFDKEDPATPLVADGWWYDSSGTSVTRVPSLVSSTLAPGLAQHLDVTGLTSSTWARIYGRANRRFKVAPGKTYTASVYLRGTAGLRILPQVYGVSDAGVGSNSWAGVRVDASDTWARLSVTFTADANTAQVYPAFVVYGGASASAGFIEGDQYQIEEGALATGWRDNGQVNSGNQASTATAVEALNAKVTQQGADLASTSSKTTSLENSLNTTNGNVAVAQAAAQNAATLAGSKGRVIVQSAAPDVADRLSQNLWIDTTGNANTPKRWTGTAWQVVTDKVATDAAAAAQSALSQVALKADSSALQTLGSTVSQQGQQIAADGQAITRIDASLNQVKSETASNASATSAITGRVNATEAGLTSVSGQLTEVSNSIGDVGGENLVYNSSFEEQDPGTPGLGNGWWYDGSAGTRVPSLVASTFATGMAQRLDITGLSASTWARLYVKQSMRFKVTPGKTYTASVYVRGTPGLRVLAQVYNLDGSGSNTTSWASARKDAALEWARLSVTFIPTSDTVLLYPAVVVYGGATATSGFIEADHYQVEEGGRATGWRDNGQVIAASNSVTSKAVDSLTSAVNQQGANLSSVSGRTTSLENGLNITNGNLASAQQAAQAAATAAGAKGEVIYSATTPAAEKRLVQNLWIDTTGNANTPKRWSGSAWVAVTDKVATDAAAAAANALAEVAKKADASAVSALNSEVKQQGSLITSQGSSITSLSNSITGLAAAGANLLLDGGFESAPLGAFSGGTVVAANARTGANSLLIAPAAGNADVLVGEFSVSPGRTIYAEAYAKASVVTSGGGSVDLQLQFRTVGQSVAWVSLQLINLSQLGGTFTKLSGTANVPAGYDKCRVYATLRRGADAAARINIDDVFVADVTEAQSAIDLANTKASSSALQSLSSIVSQQGAKIESEAKRTDGLYTSVGNANSAIQDEATTRTNADSALSTRINTAQAKADDALAAAQSEVTARANADTALGKRVDTVQSNLGSTNASVQQISTAQSNLDGKINASYSVRLQVTAGGQYVAAGFGLGADNSSGVLQSVFAVMADRFAVLNPSGNGFVSPFAIQNGQVFLNEAFISTATIQRAIVGNSINSSELANNGVPIMRMDFASGTIIMQNKAASAYTVFNRSGIDMVINGVRRIRMGEW